MQHFSPRFLAVVEPIQAKAQEQGEITVDLKTQFRDAMLALGHEERVRNLYRVKSKLSMKAEFFRPNWPQDQYLRTRKGRDVILKIRQVGFTTLTGVRQMDRVLWEQNFAAGIMAHQQNVVATIFNDIPKFIYTWFKKDWGHLYAPTEKHDSANALEFLDDGLGRTLLSSMRVMFDFRSKTVNSLHVSEASRIEKERLVGSVNGVPANGEVILESTPNGKGGEFYEQWQNWKEMENLAPYKGHFIPWYEYYPEDPDQYELPKDAQLTSYEKAMMEDLGEKITRSHIAWRRWCIMANCGGDSDVFENEYPSNDVECWFTGENSVFPSSVLKYQDQFTQPPIKTGYVLADGTRVKFHDDEKGNVSLWETPKVGVEYVAGADPSAGVGKDPAAAVIFSRTTGHQVARLWGQMEPIEFAQELWKLLIYFNSAWVCPEANNHGHVVIHYLRNTRAYRHMYKRKALDEITNKLTTQYGFLTSSQTKLMVTEKYKEACKSGKARVRDSRLISEMSTFVQIPSKTGSTIRRAASSGSHDDLVIAAALAWEMNEQRGAYDPVDEVDAAVDTQEDVQDEDTGFASW